MFNFVMFPITSTLSKTNSIRLIICLLSFFVFNSALSQQKNTVIEDDYETLKEKIRLYWNISVDRSLLYAEQMAKSTNYEHLAFANGAISCLVQFKDETEKSKKKYKEALFYLNKIPNSNDKKRLTADIYNYGGLAEWSRGNFGLALEKFQDGIKVSSQIGDVKQIIKFKSNIGLINEVVGNYKMAIKYAKECLDFIDKNENQYTKVEIVNKRSNLNLALGGAYESSFMANQDRWQLLDSAAYFYKQTIRYSDVYPYNLTSAKLSLGNIFNWKSEYKNAEKKYFEVVSLSKQNKIYDLLCVAYYDLGDIYLTAKKYNKALLFYQKSDSVAILTNLNEYTYFKSNCYQARIYNILNMPELAHKHSKIYLDRLDKFESKLREETVEVNYKQGADDLTAEMHSIEKKYKQDLFLKRVLNVFYVLLFLGIVFFLIKNIRDKKKTRKRMIAIIEEGQVNKNDINQFDDQPDSIKTKK
ncbi:lipopolysaccharide assembly protein LapB [Flavobacterium sp. MDT1-60]|uniref:tetratricopeptide repeat protein n=1 Tax=Flavobacterium sp. MDT1-60 TaxID=1979344 RepID=UPI001784E1FB|nr:AraC family transcriptional regulator [Flavobacterium sp. MDT1-60]QOG02885.1 AraC family transcriptional regulator [Flavobacterium sp. MDT1-60]